MNENAKFHSKKFKDVSSKTIIYVVLTVLCILWVCPFIYLFLQSLAVSYQGALIIPKEFTFNNYIALFTDEVYPFWKWYMNTLTISIITSILQTCLTLMSAYAFSRLRFKLRKKYMQMILIIGMFPGFLGMVVVYFILDFLGLAASIFGLVLIYIAGSAMGYYIAKGFFDTIPRSLDEAAMIDGANKNTIFWRIVMPLSKPIIVYTILMGFTAPWGDYMLASYIAQGNQDLFNVAVGLQQLITKGNLEKNFPRFCAGGIFVSIPIMVLFFWLQKYYVEGVTGGAVKG